MFLDYFLLSAAISGLTFFSRKKGLHYIFILGFLLLEISMCIFIFHHIGERFFEYFYCDALGALFLFILTLLSFAAFFHSILFLKQNAIDIKHESRYYAALMLFITAISGAYLADNLAIFWVFAEATTLFVAILILFKKNLFSLEAAWKYLFVASIGLTIAFMGILILNGLTEGSLNITEIATKAKEIDPTWFKISFLLFLTGLSVKLESFPFYPVCVDALGIAPPPVSALMSTALMNVGLIGIIRMYIAMSQNDAFPWVKNVLLIMGLLSLLIASYKIFKVKYLERLLAFSSLEHIGIILIALSLGKAGLYAAILHILFHSLIKSSLFFQVNQINHIFHTHKLKKIGDYFKYNPWGAIIFLLSFLSIAAIPPSGLFISEFLIIKAFISNGLYVIGILFLLLLVIIIFSLGNNTLHLLFTDEEDYSPKEKIKIQTLENIVPLSLLLFMIYLAFLQPQFFMDLIQQTISNF